MYIILTYDVNKKRVKKVMQTCKKYIVHVQESVFEGEITESKLNKLKEELASIVDTKVDAVCIYYFDYKASKQQIGIVADTSHII